MSTEGLRRGSTRARVVLAITLAVALPACPPPHTARPSVIRTPAVRTRAVTLIVPPIEAPRPLARESSGATLYAVGGVRVRVQGRDAEAASQAFATSLVGAGTVNGRWWFVTARGTVASAANPLEIVRFEWDLGSSVSRAFVRDGILVAVLGDGRVVRADRPARVPTVEGRPVASAAPAFEALAQPLGVAPVMAAGAEGDTSVAAETALRRFPFARLVLSSSALLSNGDVALLGNGAVYFATPAPDGVLQPVARVELGDAIQGACDLHAWGARALLTCPTLAQGGDPRTPIAPFVIERGGATRVGPAAPGPLMIGREGHTLTLPHACPDADGSTTPPEGYVAPTRDPHSTLGCTVDRDRDWREWEYPAPGRIIDVFDATALVLETRQTGLQLRYYDIDMGRGTDVRLDDPTVDIARAGFTPDGRILVIANAGRTNARRSLIGIGPPGRTLDLRPVGFLVHDVAFADLRMGLAVGENAADVAETRDGGNTWLRIEEVAVDGDPRQFQLYPPAPETSRTRRMETAGVDVHCTAPLCIAGTHLVHTWDRTVEIVPPMP